MRKRTPPGPSPTFAFHARWREELVCTAAGGSFVLELAMGKLTAYLPTEDAWPTCAPAWAIALWPVLHAELKAWCQANDAGLVVVADARVDEVAS
jgi:hypothetical protein